MKLGKAHLVGSLALVAASIAYNVWVFTKPARRSAPEASPLPLVETLQASGPVVTGEQAVAAIDPASVPAPPDVDLVRPPEWPRNPFASTAMRPVETVAAPAIPIETEPDLVVASILHSDDRRLAVVNGRIVRSGDRIGSSTIVEIQARAIVVEAPGGKRRVVGLRAPYTKVASK